MRAEDVKAYAKQLGFDVCGIAPAAAHPELAFLRDWLQRGYGGEMHYLHRTADRRADVRHVMPSALVASRSAEVAQLPAGLIG